MRSTMIATAAVNRWWIDPFCSYYLFTLIRLDDLGYIVCLVDFESYAFFLLCLFVSTDPSSNRRQTYHRSNKFH